MSSALGARLGGTFEIDFGLAEEQEQLRGTVRQFVDDKSPISEVRRLMESGEGYDPAVWRQMADEIGFQGIIIPERYGGSGLTYTELAVVFEEMGRVLMCTPYFSTMALGVNAIMACGGVADKQQLLPGIARGETRATLALAEDTGRWDLDGITLEARQSGDGWILDGAKNFVIDGHTADLVLVAARTASGLTLFAVRGDALGLDRRPLATMDMTRKLARLEFAGTPATIVGEEGSARAGLSRALQLAVVALAAEQVGGAQRCLDMSVGYAKQRTQFGRAIGSFQAIKHKCADMLLEVESARSAATYAAWLAATDATDLPLAASIAKAYCSESYFHAAAENIQIHGGIGMTWEHDAHLYFKRAKSSELLLGDVGYHQDLIAAYIRL
jgi:alkylation response protein AidB-like acyl-CoA dehydrogenase